MFKEDDIGRLTLAMIQFDGGDPKRVQHFLKVHSFAHLICVMEGVDEDTRYITECAALVHDVGIIPAERKLGRCDGKAQEEEGPFYARQVLEEAGVREGFYDRICYLVGHHHTYSAIDGTDFAILVEADFLVNFYEDGAGRDAIRSAYDKIFRTQSGKKLCREIFAL